jgi:hypothetical protein
VLAYLGTAPECATLDASVTARNLMRFTAWLEVGRKAKA